MGPGAPLDRTHRAEQAIVGSAVVVGYRPYLELIADLTAGKKLLSSGMRKETERCREALKRAAAGETVALVSSGDPGVYGMAGLAVEIAEAEGFAVDIEIVPGISAAGSAAARLGAPLMLDYACISLSDLLVPWDGICRRLEAVAAADLVVALYNPKSTRRVEQIRQAAAIFRTHRSGATPVGICTAMGTDEERLEIADLATFLECEITMRSIVIIGNSTTRVIRGRMVTPRGYRV
ncbi:MAG: precorrin-3B C(17)-methyltransferase [Candidatus Methylomirabilia bacterium]